jgi:hypothetical protein
LLRAELAHASGRLAAARRDLREGLDELAQWQCTFGSLDLQTALSGHGRALAELGLRLALADGRPPVVLEWTERARALAAQVTSVRPPADQGVAEDLAALRSLGAADPVAAGRLQERVRSQAWLTSGAGLLAQPATLERIQEALADRDGTLVAHLVLDGRLSALVVSATSAAVLPLGAEDAVQALLRGLQADLDMAAARLTSPLRHVVRDSLERRLTGLDDLLWSPLGVGEGPVVLVPSGALASAPGMVRRSSHDAADRGPACRVWPDARSPSRGPRRRGWTGEPSPAPSGWDSSPDRGWPEPSRRCTAPPVPGPRRDS